MPDIQDVEACLGDYYKLTNPSKVGVCRQILMRFWPENLEGLLKDLRERYPESMNSAEWHALYNVCLNMNSTTTTLLVSDEVTVHKKEKERLEAVVRELETVVDGLRKEAAVAKETAEGVCRQAHEESAATKQHNERIKQSFKKVSAKLRDTAAERDAFQQDLLTAEQSISYLKNEVNAAREASNRVPDLEQERSSLASDLREAHSEISYLKSTLDKHEAASSDLTTALVQVTRGKEASERLVQQFEEELQALREENSQLRLDRERTRAENEQLLAEAGRLRKELATLSDGCFEIQQLKDERQELVNKATIKTEECASLHRELENLSRELTSVTQQQQRELNDEKTALAAQIETLAKENEGLRDMLSTRSQREPSVSSPCPSVPLELADVQQTHLKELHVVMEKLHRQDDEIIELKYELQTRLQNEVQHMETIEALRAEVSEKQMCFGKLSNACTAASERIVELQNTIALMRNEQEVLHDKNHCLESDLAELRMDYDANKSLLSEYEEREKAREDRDEKDLNTTRPLSEFEEKAVSELSVVHEERGHDVISWSGGYREENAKLRKELALIKEESQAAIEDLVQRIGALEVQRGEVVSYQGVDVVHYEAQMAELQHANAQLEGERDAAQRTLRSYLCSSRTPATPGPSSADVAYEVQRFVDTTAAKHDIHMTQNVGCSDSLNINATLDELVNAIQAKEVRSLLDTFQGSSWEGVGEEVAVLFSMYVGRGETAVPRGGGPEDVMGMLKDLGGYLVNIIAEKHAADEAAKKWEREAFKAIDYERNAAVLLCKAAEEIRAVSAASALSTSVFLSAMHRP